MDNLHGIGVDVGESIPIVVETEDSKNNIVVIEDDSPQIIPMNDEILIHKGYSPFVNEETGTWFEWDNKRKVFYDTEIVARGGIDSTILNQIKQNSEDIEELQNKPEEDPTVPDWAKEENKPTYDYDEVGSLNKENTVTSSEIDLMFMEIFGH